jgi:hypothetical protein
MAELLELTATMRKSPAGLRAGPGGGSSGASEAGPQTIPRIACNNPARPCLPPSLGLAQRLFESCKAESET